MIVWSGRGFLSALVLIGTLFLSIWLLPDSLNDYSFVIAFFISAVFSSVFGKKWNNQNDRIVTDDKTGEKLRIRNNHTLFWIPMQYWGVIFSILGIAILFQQSILLSIVALVILTGLIIMKFVNNKPKSNIVSKSRFKSAKTKKKEQEVETEKLKIKAKEEAERIKRQKENEDPSRFMPK